MSTRASKTKMICPSASAALLIMVIMGCSDRPQVTPAESLAQAKRYEKGDGVPMDMVEAIRQYEVAAKGGS
ncbi:MAG: hypothetical protein RL692_310, partial [Planctomycetota bacterium]